MTPAKSARTVGNMKTDFNSDEQFRQEVQCALVTLNASARKVSITAGLGVNYINQMLADDISPTLRAVDKIRAGIRILKDGGE